MEDSNVNMEQLEDAMENLAVESVSGGMDDESLPGTSASQSNSSPSSSSHQGSPKVNKASGKKKAETKYLYSCHVEEDHGKPIYGCKFYQDLRDGQPIIFATVGSNRVTIYECTKECSIKELQCYEDPDAEESFFTCAWSKDESGKAMLAAGGLRGIIRMFSPTTETCLKQFFVHGGAINDLMFHPTDHSLLLSSSKDHSLRLWNVNTGICVVIFGGVDGHRDEVVSADINVTGSKIVSCSLDHSLKVWKLNKPEIENAIRLSKIFKTDRDIPFPTVQQNFPDFSTRDIHWNYVDCAKWLGDYIFSKSCENEIVCWKPGKTHQQWNDVPSTCTETTVMKRFEVKECDLWFIRFTLDFWKENLAVGSRYGKTFLFDITASNANRIKPSVLSHPKCVSIIRQTAFSTDGSVLICVCEDATIWRWDINKDFKEQVTN